MIFQELEQIWKQSSAWPDFLGAMHPLLRAYSPENQKGNKNLSMWASFPGICCQAAGGQADWAKDLSLAWLLFYGAAYAMDAVEDGDSLEPERNRLSPGITVNAASGLYFSASLILNNIRQNPAIREVAGEVISDFYRGFLLMCGGQHHDLSTPRPSLEEYWEIAASKSGAFFALASRSGARLATDDPKQLQGFHDFGIQLGILIQILDDIDDVQKAPSLGSSQSLLKSLPVIYALHHSRLEARARLEELVQFGTVEKEAGEEILDIIDESGAVQYLVAEYERQRIIAISALRQAKPIPGYEAKLIEFLPSIYKSS